MKTSVLKIPDYQAPLSLRVSNCSTVPSNLGAIFCGFTEIAISGILTSWPFSSRSGFKRPASKWMNVDFPVPFSPKRTTISDWLKEPASISTLKVFNVFDNDG